MFSACVFSFFQFMYILQYLLLYSTAALFGVIKIDRLIDKLIDFNGRTVTAAFAVYGCNGMEFSYVIFTEQRNFTT